VHQAGVVARQAARRGDQRDRVEQRRATGEDPAGIAGLRRDLATQIGFTGRAEERDRRAVGVVERARERRVVRRRPPLGRAVFRARREGPVTLPLQLVPRRRVVEQGRREAKTRSSMVVEDAIARARVSASASLAASASPVYASSARHSRAPSVR